MPVFQRVVLARLVARTAITFLFLGFVVLTTQILNQANLLVQSGSGAAEVLLAFTLLVPSITVIVLPIAYLIAFMHSFELMDLTYETVVMQASGARPRFMIGPSLWLAGAISVLVLGLSLVVEPAANRGESALLGSLRAETLRDIASDGALHRMGPGLFLRGGPLTADGAIQGLFVLDRREPGDEHLYVARKAVLTDVNGRPQLVMFDGTIILRGADTTGEQRVRFGRYISEPWDFLTALRVDYGPRETATGDLLARLRATPAPGVMGHEGAELVRRGTDWLFPLAYFALGAFLVLRCGPAGSRRGLPWRLPVAILVGVALRVAAMAFLARAGSTPTLAGAAVLIPITAIAVFGALTLAPPFGLGLVSPNRGRGR